MSNQHLKLQEEVWSELDNKIEEQYHELMSNCLYKGKPITKFNFEEVAEDTDFIVHWFDYIVDKIYCTFYSKLTDDENGELKAYVIDKLYNFLNEDIQDHRESEKPSEESEDNDEEVYWC